MESSLVLLLKPHPAIRGASPAAPLTLEVRLSKWRWAGSQTSWPSSGDSAWKAEYRTSFIILYWLCEKWCILDMLVNFTFLKNGATRKSLSMWPITHFRLHMWFGGGLALIWHVILNDICGLCYVSAGWGELGWRIEERLTQAFPQNCCQPSLQLSVFSEKRFKGFSKFHIWKYFWLSLFFFFLFKLPFSKPPFFSFWSLWLVVLKCSCRDFLCLTAWCEEPSRSEPGARRVLWPSWSFCTAGVVRGLMYQLWSEQMVNI